MAESGSFAERVKQQADIVRVVGEYVRLKKAGANFVGLCPFHQEKTPSFAVHPLKQIYHCFGCGVGGDVFQFVMELEKSTFPEAVRTVAEKCGIPIPRPREQSPEQRRENQQRTAIIEMHREAAAYFARQLHENAEGKVAFAYLEDRGLDREAMLRFGLGFAPSAGDALLRHLRSKYPDKVLDTSGLFSRDQGGRLYDRFRRRIIFPIANESSKVIAFGGRAMGDDMPKYLNSPETPIYSKSQVLYNLDRAKVGLREIRDPDARRIVLVEGYMDCIRVDMAGIPGVVASCGTSLTETQVRLVRRIVPRVLVWYDMDSAGRAATDRSLELLLAQEMEVDVYRYASSSVSDPDTYIRDKGSDVARAPVDFAVHHLMWELEVRNEETALRKELQRIDRDTPYSDERFRKQEVARQKFREMRDQKPRPPSADAYSLLSYDEFLMKRAVELFDLSRSEGRIQAINYLLPYVQRVPNPILRSQWATRIASELRVDEPVLRESLRRAAAERRSEVKPKAELLAPVVKPAERQLIRMLLESNGFREKLAHELTAGGLHRGLETQKIFEVLIAKVAEEPDPARLAETLEERDRRLLFALLFDSSPEGTWEAAESCLEFLRERKMAAELTELERKIQSQPSKNELIELLREKEKLRRELAKKQGVA